MTSLAAVWGQSLQGQEGGGFRFAALTVPAKGKAGFTLLNPRQTGIRFANRLTDREAAANQIRLNGSGVALGDVDGDGLCDIYVCRLSGANALFKNLGGWRFRNSSRNSAIECRAQYSTGATLADVDGDADLDLLVNGVGTGTQLFVNDGQGVFTKASNSGLSDRWGATTSTLADVDGDGDLDLYVANYRTTTIRTTGFALLRIGDQRMILPEERDRLEITEEGRVLEHGEADRFYLNDGQGRFRVLSWTDGRFKDASGKVLARAPFDWGLAAMFRDINQDGLPDLYVCNDFHSEDRVWMNQGGGDFQLLSNLSLRHTSTFSMAVDFADLNRDGLDDLFVADMLSLHHERRMMQLAAMDPYRAQVGEYQNRPQYDRNTLHLNLGGERYAEIAEFAGLSATEWTWSAVFLDVDLDGYEDLLCSTGHMFDTQDMDAEYRIREKGPWPRRLIPSKLLMFPKMRQPKLAFRNLSNLRFNLRSDDWNFNQQGVAHGMALGDLDNDGDLDVVVNNLNAPLGVYRNNSNVPRVLVRLKGRGANRYGVGARVTLESAAINQSQEMISGGRYLSSDDLARVFAAPPKFGRLDLSVRWSSGRYSRVTDVQPNRVYEIAEPSEGSLPIIEEPVVPPWFEDVSNRVGHRHADANYDDFERELLLPKKYSQMGPGVSWFDVNDDGREDLIVGTGRGGRLAVYLNRNGQFVRDETVSELMPARRDQTGIVGMRASEKRRLIVGSSNFEDGSQSGGSILEIDLNSTEAIRRKLGVAAVTGPVAIGDVDGDGDLDVFLGAHTRAGRYPEVGLSQLWSAEGDGFQLSTHNHPGLGEVGLVRGACFSDLTGDGQLDLVVACEWGAVRVFVNESGRLMDRTDSLGLSECLGWWNGVATGDFDSDGRMDIAASNWGRNHSLAARRSVSGSERSLAERFLYYGDFDGDSQTDLIEAYRENRHDKLFPVRRFADLADELSFVPQSFETLTAYNQADLPTILGSRFPAAKSLQANWFESTVFMNQGDRFEPLPLPAEAQFAPAFGVVVADFDNDRHEDIFLAQNFFPVQPFDSRIDAGRGLWLRGLGDGRFQSVSASASGIEIFGEQRGAAAADFDQDGRVDLAVAQNGGEVKLFRNLQSESGIRVFLAGGDENPNAVGAAVRIRYGSKYGPLREITAGEGYWSQNSRVLVFPITGATDAWIRWPDGQVQEVPINSTDDVVSVSQPR
ncbi:MAG: hypothetical protein M2R45_04882 [Verrucomicrobia subdivision 3 bacterium]|nr:hypothetical protein [Limisphaerales bacterium]MCS1414376.1 hypothetical protein [Limisphaerales bacterium]